MKIKDMEVGKSVDVELVLAEASIRKTRTQKDYLQLTLTDGTDKMDGKVWDYNTQLGVPEAKHVYCVTGIIGEYQGKKQITISKLQLSDNQDLSRFTAIYYDEYEALFDKALNTIEGISNPVLRRIVFGFYQDNADVLKVATSARGVHHMGVGGNIVHSLEVAQLGVAVCNIIEQQYVDTDYQVNRDLVLAGAMMHDVGKAWTYDMQDPSMEYTRLGREEDHIVLGIRMLDHWLTLREPELYDSAEAYALRHIITSHHGTAEKGSPAIPNFMEAVIVDYADGLSATLNALQCANRKALAEGKPTTDKVWVMENRVMTLQKNVLPVVGGV